jgi:hypothetical protein
MKDTILSIFLITVAVLFRTVLHLGPNFELVTSATLAAGYFITNSKLKLAVPVFIMFISDSMLGNDLIFIFTWSAYILMPVIGGLVKRFSTKSPLIKAFMIEGAALLSVVLFFLWTNAGVVLVSNLYPKSIQGLASSYINGLPFVKPQLFSALLTAPILFAATALLTKAMTKLETKVSFKKATQISIAI